MPNGRQVLGREWRKLPLPASHLEAGEAIDAEIVETKLLAGRSGYDIVVPSGPFRQRLIKAGVFAPLDRAKIPNLVHQWPEVTKRLAVFDPGNKHAVNEPTATLSSLACQP